MGNLQNRDGGWSQWIQSPWGKLLSEKQPKSLDPPADSLTGTRVGSEETIYKCCMAMSRSRQVGTGKGSCQLTQQSPIISPTCAWTSMTEIDAKTNKQNVPKPSRLQILRRESSFCCWCPIRAIRKMPRTTGEDHLHYRADTG